MRGTRSNIWQVKNNTNDHICPLIRDAGRGYEAQAEAQATRAFTFIETELEYTFEAKHAHLLL
jgi:hypothetical protein